MELSFVNLDLDQISENLMELNMLIFPLISHENQIPLLCFDSFFVTNSIDNHIDKQVLLDLLKFKFKGNDIQQIQIKNKLIKIFQQEKLNYKEQNVFFQQLIGVYIIDNVQYKNNQEPFTKDQQDDTILSNYNFEIKSENSIQFVQIINKYFNMLHKIIKTSAYKFECDIFNHISKFQINDENICQNNYNTESGDFLSLEIDYEVINEEISNSQERIKSFSLKAEELIQTFDVASENQVTDLNSNEKSQYNQFNKNQFESSNFDNIRELYDIEYSKQYKLFAQMEYQQEQISKSDFKIDQNYINQNKLPKLSENKSTWIFKYYDQKYINQNKLPKLSENKSSLIYFDQNYINQNKLPKLSENKSIQTNILNDNSKIIEKYESELIEIENLVENLMDLNTNLEISKRDEIKKLSYDYEQRLNYLQMELLNLDNSFIKDDELNINL